MKLYNIHTHSKSKKQDKIETVDILNISIGQDQSSSLSQELLYSCGIHPWNVDSITDDLFDELERLSVLDNVVAIGEVGLDKLSKSSYTAQLEIFKIQLNIAKKVDKPVIIHCIKAWDDLIAVCKKNRIKNPLIIHGFRGKPEQALQLCNQDFYLSIGEHYNVGSINEIPIDRLLLETDMSTWGIIDIYKKVSKDLDIDIEKLIKIVTCNMKKVFHKTNI